MQATFSRQKGVMVPGVLCVDRGNWGRQLALCVQCFANNFLARIAPYTLMSHTKMVGPRIIVLESQPGKQSSRSKRFREITTEPLTV